MFEDSIPGSGQSAGESLNGNSRAVWRGLGYAVLFLIWLAASAVLIRAAARHTLGPFTVDGLSEKLVALEAIQSDINIVLIGSSRSARQIDPALLASEGAALGCDLRAFNMGISGFSTNEMDYILRWMTARGVQIPWVVMESKGTDWLGPISSDRLYEHLRPFNYRLLDVANEGFSQPPGSWQIHLSLLGSALNLGLAHRYLDRAPVQADWLELGRSGYRPLAWMFNTLETLPGRQANLQDLLAENPDYITEKFQPDAPYEGPMYEIAPILSRSAHRAGAQRVTFISPPGSEQLIFFTGYHAFTVPGLEYPPYHIGLNLQATPQLADSDYWFDIGHLTQVGADIYTRYLAAELCGLQQSEQTAAAP